MLLLAIISHTGVSQYCATYVALGGEKSSLRDLYKNMSFQMYSVFSVLDLSGFVREKTTYIFSCILFDWVRRATDIT